MTCGVQVARTQAVRALDAVRRRHRRAAAARPGMQARVQGRAGAHRPHGRPGAGGAARGSRAAALHGVSPLTLDRTLQTIAHLPPVRAELVAAASARLAAGQRPSAEAIADMAIRRATCDLLG
jgi:hypothetical protein